MKEVEDMDVVGSRITAAHNKVDASDETLRGVLGGALGGRAPFASITCAWHSNLLCCVYKHTTADQFAYTEHVHMQIQNSLKAEHRPNLYG